MNLFNVKSLDDLSSKRKEILDEISLRGFAIIRGLFDPNQIVECKNAVFREINNGPIHGTTQGSRDLVRKNSLKWSVGGATGAQVGNARLMVMAYNPISSPDIYKFRSSFQHLICIRDILRNDGLKTSDEFLIGGGFNACRFQVYPSGGGFMLGHRDFIAEKSSLEQNAALLQLLLFMTEKGVDFKEGGAYLVHEGVKIDIESIAKPGDIAIYDGKSFHGVEDIDPQKPLNTSYLEGRMVALVTIYS